MEDDAVSRICSSTVDGRAITPRFRQHQLAALHSTLVKSKTDILTAINNDTRHTRSEAEVQYYLTLQALKTIYLTLDPLKMIEDEYSLARSQSNSSKRVPYGCAYIVPSPTSAFYSALVPVAAAIASGNCVVLELQQNLSELNALLRRILPAALDRHTFTLVDKDPFDADFKHHSCILLDGRANDDALTTSTQSIATPASRVAAVVDRSANLPEAAKECVRARFAFGGGSAYAPDVVLVNEFKVKEFCSAVAEAALAYLTATVEAQSNGSATQPRHARKPAAGPSSDLQQQLDDASATILASGSRGTVALLPSAARSSKILLSTITEPVLLIHPVSSLDDAIDFLNASSSQPLLAAHIFAAPESAKYLAQFINASASFVNRVPAELLVGPAAPLGFPTSISPRYTPEMFSIARPEHFQHPSPLSVDVLALLDGAAGKGLGQLHEVSLPAIKVKAGPPVGFFEQGMLVGLGLALSTIIASTTLTAIYLYPAVMRRIRS